MTLFSKDAEGLRLPGIDRHKEEMAEVNPKARDGKLGKSQSMREELKDILNKGWSQEATITALVNYFGETSIRPDMISFFLNGSSDWNGKED